MKGSTCGNHNHVQTGGPPNSMFAFQPTLPRCPLTKVPIVYLTPIHWQFKYLCDMAHMTSHANCSSRPLNRTIALSFTSDTILNIDMSRKPSPSSVPFHRVTRAGKGLRQAHLDFRVDVLELRNELHLVGDGLLQWL